MGGRPLLTMTTSKIAIMAACLFAASGLAWAMLPASEAGGYGEWAAAKEGGGEPGVSGNGNVEAAPVVGTMTMYVEDGGKNDGRSGGGGGAGSGARVGGLGDAAPAGGVDAVAGTVDGPAGSAQGWCKKGLEARTNANTGDMVCVPYGYADGEDGARWIEPRSGPVDGAGRYGGIAGGGGTGGGAAGEGAGDGGYGGYGERMDGTPGITWKWVSPQEASLVVGDGPAGAYELGLAERIADLEEINEGLMRTIARLQEALMEIHLEGHGAVDGDSADLGVAGRAWPSDGGASGSPAQPSTVSADASATPTGGGSKGVCLHGTDAMFTSVIDPAALPETGGSLGAIPMPDGRYTVLLMAASSTPVSVGIWLAGDGGLEYDRTFALEDTGRPPGEDATMWDYNSGAAELVVDRPQMVNATAAVTGGDGLPVFASLARCR